MKVDCDQYSDKGILGGLVTGLFSPKNYHNLIVACDMPFLNSDEIKRYDPENLSFFNVNTERDLTFANQIAAGQIAKYKLVSL